MWIIPCRYFHQKILSDPNSSFLPDSAIFLHLTQSFFSLVTLILAFYEWDKPVPKAWWPLLSGHWLCCHVSLVSGDVSRCDSVGVLVSPAHYWLADAGTRGGGGETSRGGGDAEMSTRLSALPPPLAVSHYSPGHFISSHVGPSYYLLSLWYSYQINWQIYQHLC